MFLWDWFDYFLNLFGFNKKGKLLFLGLDNAGKSTLMDRVKSGRLVQHPPTLLPRSQQFQVGRLSLMAYDLGGHKQARRVWKTYFPAVDGLIFIVDCCDMERIGEVREELDEILKDELIKDCPVAILGNKVDRSDAVGEEKLKSLLGIEIFLTGKQRTDKEELNGRPVELFMCSVLLKQGYGEAFRWLAHYMN